MLLLTSTEPVQWRLTDITEHWGSRGGHVISLGWFVAAMGVMAMLVGAVWLRRLYLHRKLHPGPGPIFRNIARSIGLASQDRWLLWRIASRQHLPSPLTLMFSSGTLDYHADRYVQSLPEYRREQVRRRIATIGKLLFEPP